MQEERYRNNSILESASKSDNNIALRNPYRFVKSENPCASLIVYHSSKWSPIEFVSVLSKELWCLLMSMIFFSGCWWVWLQVHSSPSGYAQGQPYKVPYTPAPIAFASRKGEWESVFRSRFRCGKHRVCLDHFGKFFWEGMLLIWSIK